MIDTLDSMMGATRPMTAGIPQSAANPLAAELERPWMEEQAAQEQERAKRAADYMTKLDSMLLDPDAFFKKNPLQLRFGEDPEQARKDVQVQAYLRMKNGGRKADSADYYDLLRARVAHDEFQGRGAVDKNEFHGELVKSATMRRDEKEFTRNLITAAINDATLPPEERKGLTGFLTESKGGPGYEARKVADYAEQWRDAGIQMAERIQPFKDVLNLTWLSMVNKSGIPAEALSKVPDEAWPDFLAALRLRAETLPEAERETFLAGMRKDFNRAFDSFFRNAGEAATGYGLAVPTDESVLLADSIYGTTNYQDTERGRVAASEEYQRQTGRASEVRRIMDGSFDPIDYVKGWGWLQKAPGVTYTSLTMAVPVVGFGVMAASMQGAAQESLYLNMRDAGLNESDASGYAGMMAPAVMIPQVILEKTSFGLISQKNPAVRRALNVVGDRIANRAARLAVKTGAITAAEGTIEVLQDFTQSAVQDIASALQPAIPDVDLGEAFTGAWAQFPEIAGSMVFLSLMGAAGGMSREAQAAAWAKATPLERRALGIRDEDSAAIDAAQGPSSLTSAVDAAWQNRDANSQEAKDAAEQLAQQARRARQAAAMLENIGYTMPSITAMPDGTFVVRDSMTSEELGRAGNLEELDAVVRAHSVAMEAMQEDEMLQLVTFIKAAQTGAKASGIEQELNLSRRFGMADVEAMGPAAMERFMAEVALQEQAEGGDGSAARVVFGYNTTEARDGVRRDVNRIFQGANIGTIFHENWHAARRKAKAAGSLTREDDIRLLRALDTVLEPYRMRSVKNAQGGAMLPSIREAFIPAGMDDAAISDEMLDESIAEVAEVLTFLFPRGHKTNKHGLTRRLVSMHIGTVGRLAPEATRKFTAFIRAIRARMGLAMSRAYHLKKAIAKGELDVAELDGYMAKMMGTDQQEEHDDGVRAELNRILSMPDDVADDDIPFSVGRASVSATEFGEALLDRIGEDELRLEQPRAKYEDKRQLLLEFAKSIIEGDSKDDSQNGSMPGRFGPLQILRERFAKKLTLDPQIRFIGESLKDLTDLVERAQSLRNPLFETFYLVAIKSGKKSDKVLDAMAITSRVPCAAKISHSGQTTNEAFAEQAEFLRRAGADEYYLIHNHPSGDPSPSKADKELTRIYDQRMGAEGFRLRSHVVINHRTFQNITVEDTAGQRAVLVSEGSLDGIGQADPYQWPLWSNDIGVKIDDPLLVAELGMRLASAYQAPDAVLGFITNNDYKVVSVVAGKADDFLVLTHKQLQDYARDQGGMTLMLHAKAVNQTAAIDMLKRFQPANADRRVAEMVVTYPGGGYQSGNEIGLFSMPPTGQRFFNGENAEGTRVQESRGSFSIGRADVAERMAGGALSLVRDPIRRVQAMSRIARDFGDLALSFQRIEAMAGRRRGKAQLRQEANAREDLAAEEKIGAVWAKYGSVMADDDLTRLKAQPVFSALAVTRADGSVDPLRGRLMSKAQAIKKHADRYALHRAGEYDGADGISRTVFGGTLMPDQAAQELFDHGLITEPTPDAMWEALAREQQTVEKMKGFLKKAQEDIREAKREAKREANEWLATQSKEQETNYNPKEEILASLRMLDAILLALPAEIRGKIGGYTQMARIATDEARLAFLKDRLKKADKELETYLREAFNKEWLDLLNRAKPDKDNPGERPTGVIDADALDILRIAERAMGMTFAEGETEADRLDALANHEDTKPDEVEKLRAMAQMVRLTSNWWSADAARREQAVTEGTRIYYGGLAALKIKQSRRRERLAALQSSAKRGTGKAGSRMEREEMKTRERSSRAGQVGRLVWEFLSFGQLVNVLFGEKSDAAKWFNAREIAASNAYEDGVQAKVDALEAMFESLSGSRFTGEKLRHRMQNEKGIRVMDATGKEQTFSESQAITFLLMWRQEDGRRHMEGQYDEEGNLTSEWGWTQESADAVETALSNEGKAMLAFLGNSYGEEYGRINDVFRRIWNVSMPRHKMYAPLTVKAAMGKQDAIVDPVSGDSMGAGMTPGSLKNRSQTAVAEPDFLDAFQVFMNHARQMEHFIAYAEFARDAQAIVNRREMRNSIEAISPTAATTLSKWIEYFSLGGLKEASAGGGWQQFFSGTIARLSAATLVGRVSVLGMQALQLGAAVYKMPMGAYLSRFARLTMGRLGWGDAIRSAYIQRRLKDMPPIVRDAVMGMAAGSPNRAKYAAAKAARSISGADALFTAGTYAILYDYHLTQAKKSGVADPEQYAHAEAERLTDQVAQPMRTGARSWLEISMQNQPAFRALWNFSTDPRQKMSLIVYDALRHDLNGAQKAAAVGKAVAITWAVSGILQAVVRSVFRDLRSDDDDEIFDERHWDLKRLGMMAATGPVGGVPFLGSTVDQTLYGMAGEWATADTILSAVPKAAVATKRVATGESDDILKDVESILGGGAAASSTSAAAASAMHLVRDAVNIYENFDDDTGDE